MANYYHPYSTPGSGSSRASSGSPLSSVSSHSPPDSTGYFAFSPAPPSPYYYATEYTNSPSDYSYQGSISSRSSSSQGHYRHLSSSSTSSNQGLGYDQQHDGRTKRQRVAALPVDSSGHLQPHWMDQSQADFAAGMYHPQSQLQSQHQYRHQHQQHSQMQMQMPYASAGYSSQASHGAISSVPVPSHSHGHPVGNQPSPITQKARAQANSPSLGGQEREEDAEEGPPFEHGPTELPPRTFSGHSKYNPPKKPGKIPGSAMDYLPILEARFERLENAIDRYIEQRGQRALSNSILPGSSSKDSTSPKTR